MVRQSAKKSKRSFVVFVSLVTVLTATSALLLALAPAPMMPDPAASLYAVDGSDSMGVVFDAPKALSNGRWKYIYVHHSNSPAGNAQTMGTGPQGLADHFIIGNGEGAVDGEIQIGQRWLSQDAALPPVGANQISPDCISICLVGDFDKTVPTRTQLKQLAQLTSALQGHFHVPLDHVLFVEHTDLAAGIGRYFPTTGFREQLLP